MDHLYYLCLVFVMLCVCLWTPAGKGLTSWLLFVMLNGIFVTFPCGILGQVWYLIVSIPDLCRLNCFIQIFIERSVTSGLDLHCLHMSLDEKNNNIYL